MKYIKLTKEQAEEIKGRHGNYSFIEPINYNGSYLIPYEVLRDSDLIEVREKILSYNGEIIEPIFTYEDKTPIVINEEIKPTLEERVTDIEQVTTEVITALNDKGIVL